MDYEKLYKDTLERAKNTIEVNQTIPDIVECVKFLFPELAESEDERIRKAIIQFFELQDDNTTYSFIPKKDILAWLEKQDPEYKAKVIRKEFGNKAKNSNEEIQEKQESTDKVEPKFKVGDKIRYLKCGGTIMTIEKIENGEYIFTNNMGHTTIESGNKWYLVEQTPVWSEEDEKYTQGLIRGLKAKRDIFKFTTFSSDSLNITSTIDWLESLKNRVLLYPVSVEYNEEDIDNIADTFIPEPVWNALEESKGEGSNAAAYDYSQMIAMFKAGVHWLESLKNRIQPQPKREWSKEDNKIIEEIINDIECARAINYHAPKEGYEFRENWLKSLRPQNTWRPSDEQMKALSSINLTGGISYARQGQELINLYNDLKKLKE